MSGVFYLHHFEDVKDLEKAGTELAPNSPEGEGNFCALGKQDIG